MNKDSKWLPDNMRNGYFILTNKNIALVSGLFSLLLLPLGIYTYVNNTTLDEVKLEYTRCKLDATSSFSTGPGSIQRWKYDNQTQVCTMEFTVSTTLSGPVHLYVRISNMYQNARLYMKSQSDEQLKGTAFTKASLIPSSITSCGFLQYANCDTASQYTWIGNGWTHAQNNPDCLPEAPKRDAVVRNANADAQYYPCGLIANSMFSDDIGDLTCISGGCQNYAFGTTGIAWPEDAAVYKRTNWLSDATLTPLIPTHLIPPPQWRKAWPQLYANGYNATNVPDLAQWERFQVWMRKAGLPQFRKLWGKGSGNLQPGVYQIQIKDNWDCLRFKGTKSVIFSEVGFLGSKDPFLGYALLVVGILCALSAILVLVVKIRTPGDPTLFSWNKEKRD
ncbi:CDC50/LEM3 family [Gorgonomyces haynaldii]|nr:CDC50/LEM3 family [Gorgonomyces haynaldii]